MSHCCGFAPAHRVSCDMGKYLIPWQAIRMNNPAIVDQTRTIFYTQSGAFLEKGIHLHINCCVWGGGPGGGDLWGQHVSLVLS